MSSNEVKVGDVRLLTIRHRDGSSDKCRYVVSALLDEKFPRNHRRYALIFNNGSTCYDISAVSIKNDKLLASYNNWREAVNSSEFIGEHIQ